MQGREEPDMKDGIGMEYTTLIWEGVEYIAVQDLLLYLKYNWGKSKNPEMHHLIKEITKLKNIK